MDQRYIDTVRACKVILRNLDHLDETATSGQRAELGRLLEKLRLRIHGFIEADLTDEGLRVGEL